MDAGAMVTGGRAGKVAGRGRAADGRATQTLGLPDPSSLELSTHLRSSVLTPHFCFSHAEGISSTRGRSFPHSSWAQTGNQQSTLYPGPVAFKGGISSPGSAGVTVEGDLLLASSQATHKGNLGVTFLVPVVVFLTGEEAVAERALPHC